MDGETPKYLYHYTNVDSLALILKNRTLRLNSLDKMDDLQEQMSNDKQNFGKFVFVSSWTSEIEESIPMWRMYTPKQRGIRIKLPINPFQDYSAIGKDLEHILHMKFDGDGNAVAPFKTIIPFNDLINGGYTLLNFASDKQLFEVKYTNDNTLLNPTLLSSTQQDGTNIALGKLGIYKNSYWNFQKEWRYRLMFLPASTGKIIHEHMDNRNNELSNLIKLISVGQASLPFSHFDLKLKEESLEDMTITLAPDISESAKIFVELLVEKYNPSCKIEKSKLADLIQ